MADFHLSEDLLREKTTQDSTLLGILKSVRTGWRDLEYSKDTKHFFRKRNQLSVENKIIICKTRKDGNPKYATSKGLCLSS